MKIPSTIDISMYLQSERNYDEFTAMGFADKFWHYYESVGWKVGKHEMKSWKAAVRTWELNQKKYATNQQSVTGPSKQGTSSARIDRAKNW
jgi:hypothetical protein